jgi:2'-5' RNA ligase
MEQIRSFVAIELSEPIKESLSSIMSKLQPSKHPYVKWVAPDGIHLTLKFLGNIYADQVPGITEAIVSGTRGVSPFEIQLGTPGAFPNLQQPRVIWVAVTGEIERIKVLQQDIDTALSHFGFPTEKRPFKPHLTLGRLKERASPAERSKIGKLIASITAGGGSKMKVEGISLMRSTLMPSGAVYDRLASIELKGR